MLENLGGFFGYLIILLYILTILNYFVKLINRKYKEQIKKNERFHQIFTKVMRFLVKQHKLFGLLTIVFILLHFLIQFNRFGLSITGAIAAGVMLLQVALGIYGSKAKKKSKAWLYVHRAIAVILAVTILIHIL
ncbi:MAG TPA: hypothetical protein VN258_19895 [Mobilitalea sp.]|nr:hypothetical protein [Mobilitalea sp.]